MMKLKKEGIYETARKPEQTQSLFKIRKKMVVVVVVVMMMMTTTMIVVVLLVVNIL